MVPETDTLAVWKRTCGQLDGDPALAACGGVGFLGKLLLLAACGEARRKDSQQRVVVTVSSPSDHRSINFLRCRRHHCCCLPQLHRPALAAAAPTRARNRSAACTQPASRGEPRMHCCVSERPQPRSASAMVRVRAKTPMRRAIPRAWFAPRNGSHATRAPAISARYPTRSSLCTRKGGKKHTQPVISRGERREARRGRRKSVRSSVSSLASSARDSPGSASPRSCCGRRSRGRRRTGGCARRRSGPGAPSPAGEGPTDGRTQRTDASEG